MLSDIEFRILKKISPSDPDRCSGDVYKEKSKLLVLLGLESLQKFKGKVVVDFGCGEGTETIDVACAGAKLAIGIDNRESVLEIARQRAIDAGLNDACSFVSSSKQIADIIISIDGFEHFDDPAESLTLMYSVLRGKGEALVAFGPTWYHPYGGHLFSVFPWAHLLFSEKALIRWRSTFKHDGATRFNEVAGGLNRMSIRRFEKLIAASPFGVASFQCVPIRKLGFLHCRLTREFTTAIVRCRLVKPVNFDTLT